MSSYILMRRKSTETPSSSVIAVCLALSIVPIYKVK